MNFIQKSSLMLTIITTFVSFNLTYTKNSCGKGKEWKNGACRTIKSDHKKNISKTLDGQVARTTPTPSLEDQAVQLVQAIQERDLAIIIQILVRNKNMNVDLLDIASQLPENRNPHVRCMQSNQDCGLTFVGKVIKGMQNQFGFKGTIDQDFIQMLLDEQNTIEKKPAMGSNPNTYAPQIFTIDKKFQGKGLVGNYFSNSSIATIHDPSGNNQEHYTFKQVEEVSNGGNAPAHKILIGSYLAKPKCAPGQMCIMMMRDIQLYAILQTDENKQEKKPHFEKTSEKMPRKYTPFNGFRAPDDDRFEKKGNGMMHNIHNKTDQTITLAFIGKKQSLLSTETIPAHGTIRIPQQTKTIKIGNQQINVQLNNYKAYSIVSDNQGNLSIQSNQIYF